MIGADGSALRRLPMLAPEAMKLETETDASLMPDGQIVGATITTGTGPSALILRFLSRAFQPHGREARDVAERQLASLGENGTGSFLMPDINSLAPEATAVGNFTLEPQPGLLEGDAFTLPLGLTLFTRPGDFLLGPANRLSLPEDEPVPCLPGQQVEELSLVLPKDRAPTKLPKEQRIEQGPFRYLSHWSMHDNVVTAHRELTSRIDQPLCEGTLRPQAAEMLRLIRRDRQATIALAPASATE